MSGVEKIEIDLTKDQGAASVCEVRKTGSVIDFQFLGVGDRNIFEPQLSQRIECYISVGTSTLHEALEVKPAPHRFVEISGYTVDLAMERFPRIHRHTVFSEVLGEDQKNFLGLALNAVAGRVVGRNWGIGRRIRVNGIGEGLLVRFALGNLIGRLVEGKHVIVGVGEGKVAGNEE
jgi:hypothetical protein